VGLGKLNVAVDVLLQPGITLGNRAIMHVIVQIRINDGYCGQVGEIGWETGEWLV
jgi:hypothetical protein